MKDKQYQLTQKYLDDVYHVIYNDLPSTLLYPVSETVDRFNEDILKEILLPKEKWCRIESDSNTLAITSFGRMINTHTIRQLKPSITPNNVLFYIDGKSVKSSDVFEQQGWKHDMVQIKKYFDDNKWRYTRP